MKEREMINHLFVDVFNDILQIEEKSLKNAGLTNLSIKEVHVLQAISEAKEPTMSKVAFRLRVTIGTLTTAINTLVKKNYVERVDCKDDRRVVRLKLTDTGEAACAVHEKFHADFMDQTLVHLTEEELDTLSATLEKLRLFFVDKLKV